MLKAKWQVRSLWMVALVAAVGSATPGRASAWSAGAVPGLEVAGEASVLGGEVRLRQVARWSAGDRAYFASVADLVVARFEPGQARMTIELQSLRETLAGAGLAGGDVAFRGSAKVTVTRLDAKSPNATTSAANAVPKELAELLEADTPTGGTASVPTAMREPTAVREPAVPVSPAGEAQEVPDTATRGTSSSETPRLPAEREVRAQGMTLREALVRDLVDRTGLKYEDVEVTFDAADEKVLRAAEPTFTWSIQSIRAGNLGAVRWSVTIWMGRESNAGQRREISARARAWQTQLLLKRGLAQGQQVREGDVEERRVLVDRMPEEALLAHDQAMMMQAGRQLAPGTVLTVRTLNPMLLVKTGQLVTVTLVQGAFEVKAVARAMEGGAFGNNVRLKNETTGDVLQATVTGPQQARLGPPIAEGN